MSAPFAIVDLDQGTAAWRAWRHDGLGASDAPVVMGESPYRGAGALHAEKRGPPANRTPNAAMMRGTLLEPEARELYVQRTGVAVRPACLQSTRFDWLRASVDGISIEEKRVVEIKCGNGVYWKTAKTRNVPIYYYGQLQHILAVTQYEFIDFWCYLPDQTAQHIAVPRDDAYIERLLDAEERFWLDIRRPRPWR